MSEVALKVELCGKLADTVGADLTLPIAENGISVASLFAQLAEHPGLEQELAQGRIRACINEQMASADHQIMPGDMVALFPPVSGG